MQIKKLTNIFYEQTMLFNKYSVSIMAMLMLMLMLMSPLARAVYYNASAGMRDVNVHYVNDGRFRTMHGHTDMDNIPFGSAFSEMHTKGTSADYFGVQIMTNYQPSFYVRGAYTYNVYALPCNQNVTSCYNVKLVNRVVILEQGFSDGVSPLHVKKNPKFSLLDTSFIDQNEWGVTLCTGLEHDNKIYKVDDAACPGLVELPPPQCPLGEY